MAVVELAHDDRGHGAPVVLLHAFPTDRTLWNEVATTLADKEWRIITPDFRGFGASALGHDTPDLNVVADDVIALLDRLGIDTAVIGGLSLGGYVTMNIVARYPERLRGFILADTKAAADDEAGAERRRAIADTVERDGNNDAYVDGWMNTLVGNTTRRWRPEVVERVRLWATQTPVATVAYYQRAMATRPDSFQTLQLATVPALVVVGTEDEISPMSDAEAMRVTLAQAVLNVVATSGHLSAIEAPDEVASALHSYLTSIS